jgi:hypothetical protein
MLGGIANLPTGKASLSVLSRTCSAVIEILFDTTNGYESKKSNLFVAFDRCFGIESQKTSELKLDNIETLLINFLLQ